MKRRSQDFYTKIVIIGLIYLASDPALIISSYLLAEWNRQFYYHLMDQGLHVALQVFMLLQMHRTDSAFNKSVTEFSALPGAGG